MERLINYKNIRSISVHRKEIWKKKETVTRWEEPSFWKRLFTNNWKKINKKNGLLGRTNFMILGNRFLMNCTMIALKEL